MRVSLFSRLGAIVFAVGGLAVPPAHATRYHIVDLGTRPMTVDINDRAEVAGYKVDMHNAAHPLELRLRQWRQLPSYDCADCSGTGAALGINNRGDLAGWSGDSPVIWPHGGGVTALQMPGPSLGGRAEDITDHQVVAGNYIYPSTVNRCFRWSAAEGSVDLGFMGHGDYCEAWAINDAGQIVGDADVEPHGTRHAFVYGNGAFLDLGSVDGADTEAMSINRQGHVLFGTFHTSFVWKDGHVIDLREGTSYAYVSGSRINDRDEIIGSATTAAGSSNPVLIANGHVTRLEPEIDGLDDWQLWYYTCINNLGVIAGYGYRTGDQLGHAFMLVPIP